MLSSVWIAEYSIFFFYKNPGKKFSHQGIKEIYLDADGILDGECANMKSAKKHDEDGLQYSGEKLIDNLAQTLVGLCKQVL
jgi:hypothetical protein